MNFSPQSVNQIKCVQINLQRSKISTANLVKLIDEYNIDLMLVREPYVFNGKVCGFSLNYRVIQCENGEKPKTAIIVVNKALQAINITYFARGYAALAKIKFISNDILFISMYCSPTSDINNELNFISNAINTINPQNLIDSNAHSENWFSCSDDTRGETLNQFISSENLIIHNNNENTPTFYTIRNETIYQSAIDLTLTNLNASTLISEWKLSLRESLSDHRLISFELNVKREPIKFKNTLKFNTKTADWIRFEELART